MQEGEPASGLPLVMQPVQSTGSTGPQPRLENLGLIVVHALQVAQAAFGACGSTMIQPTPKLTGYGNIATAVNAVKLGAVDYLSKPADADDVVIALLASAGEAPEPPENPMSADRVRWEHIPARLRVVRPQGLGDGAPVEHDCVGRIDEASRRAGFTRHFEALWDFLAWAE
jgi:hypothetical protein